MQPMRTVELGTAHITQKGIDYVHEVLASGRITYGSFSQRFETLFARMHSSRFAVLSNSGTSSLQVALHALKILKGWKDGDKILVPSTTFVASVNVILQNGLVPRFVDVDPQHYDLQAKLIESAITKRTRGIMVVHLFGQPADMSKILPIARRHKLSIIEDSCETMFAKHKGRVVGSWGDVACFSMYTAHLVTTGVGGVATTNNHKLALLMKSLCNHGRDSVYLSIDDDADTSAQSFSFVLKNRFKFRHIGYSYRVTELEAALGLSQLETYADIIVPRQRNAAYLTKRLHNLEPFFQLPSHREGSEHVYMVYPLVIRDARIKRDDLLLFLEKRGIETRYLLPLINQPVYRFLKINPKDYPVSTNLNHHGFYIGCHQKLSKQDLDYVITAFNDYIRQQKLS
ncbi:hypothetical protein COU89_02845 [Candidatus Roizmanbacteria bacterium CG10_big_fil_rev_8_21_14_0_10_45_7]|uniref:DegT/DnrJ/EryC1/StrS family aminotransferase n=1 Tax=Candidatus Roizmanbacteria bacterium CG10_big_fil_rev_8_21_14_0_10_45_7 TaxID=1974854 RepID=A0A2M8KUH8_9BACT|nr:MAG: hypothetical protein COU89_02845 [Candidatus Roizmanbacteria bacterium CG10_big_fil_rev_8_21_14_0_10_45_7]